MIDDVTRDFIQRHSTCDTRTLALQAARFPGVDMRVAITQIEGWQAAVNKLPQWAATEGIIYPPKIFPKSLKLKEIGVANSLIIFNGNNIG